MGKIMGHWSTEDELAKAVQDNSYSPTMLESCEKVLTPDLGSQTVRLTQFALFNRPHDRHPDRYLVLQPQFIFNPGRKTRTGHETEAPSHDGPVEAVSPGDDNTREKEVQAAKKKHLEEYVEKLVNHWTAGMPLADDPPNDVASVGWLRKNLAASLSWHTKAGAKDAWRIEHELHEDMSDQQFLEKYKSLHPRIVNMIVRSGLDGLSAAVGSPIRLPDYPSGELGFGHLKAALAGLAFPSAFQSLSGPNVFVALCTTYQQIWTPKGYTRGELVGSLSLAPGERLTLEIHSWDKTSTHSEAELALESEMRSSEKHTQRDALTVLQEYASKSSSKVEAKGTIPIPDMPIGVGAEGETESQSKLTKTSDRVRDDVIESASVLKINRKLKVESSRETGREQKQTRVVENTNRCHTLNCHYFEIIANYLVTTVPVGVEPCLLITYPRINFTADVVLCHEGTLRQSLLDRTFLPGFQAAHDLKVAEEEELVEARRRAERQDLAGAQLAPYAQVVADAYRTLVSDVEALDEAIEQEGYAHPMAVAMDLTPQQQDRIWAWFGLPVLARNALARFVADLGAGINAADAIRSLVMLLPPGIPPREYYDAFLELNERLGSFEDPPSDSNLTELTRWRLTKDLIDCDDAGLRSAFQIAAQSLRTIPAVDFSELTSASARDIAVAKVDFDRLVCHLEDNWMHYNHAIWSQESFDQRFERFTQLGWWWAARIIENRIIGFHGQRVAFPLRDTEVVTATDLNSLLNKMREAIKAFTTEPVLIAVPSSGQVLEATVGKCNACEDYIEQSRTIDVRLQGANAKRAEVEAARRDALVQAGHLEAPESRPPSLSVDVHTDANEPHH